MPLAWLTWPRFVFIVGGRRFGPLAGDSLVYPFVLQASESDRMLESVRVSTTVAASADTVWRRISTPSGVNFELSPFLRMTFPQDLPALSSDVPVPAPLGRCWLLLFGLLPIDYDDLVIVAV